MRAGAAAGHGGTMFQGVPTAVAMVITNDQ